MKNLFDFSNARIANLGEPTEIQLGLINKIAPKSVRAEDVFVFGSAASNSEYDSFHSVMDDSSLRNYADDFKSSRAFLAHHDDKDFPLGRTFDSLYDEGSGLSVATYVTRGIHLNKVAADDFIRAVETGIAKDVSIRYHGGEEVCELCHNRVLSRSCDHMPGIRYDGKLASYRIIDAHAAEMSTVFKGSNPKTSILKARELNTRGMIDEKTIASWNITHGCDIRADMERPEIIQLAKDLDLSDNLERFFSYERGEVYWMRGDWDEPARKKATKEGDAFSDESYPIKTQKDVEDAMRLAGSSKTHSKEAVHAHIKKMVKKLGLKMPAGLEDSDSRSYLERFTEIMDKTRDVDKNGKDPSGDECGHPGCTLKKGHDGDHSNERAFAGTDQERVICDVFLDYIKSRGATTSPDNLGRIKEFLERAEKGEHPKPPYDAMQEHVDDDDKDDDDAHDTKKRYLIPSRKFGSITEYLKTRSEMTNKAGPMATMAKGTPDAFSKGHNAGLIYPSTEPLQSAPSEAWSVSDGAPTPDDADKGAGAGVASISNPLIEIRPDGTVNLLLDGSAKVHGEASVNGLVPMRSEVDPSKIEEVPFKSVIVPFRAQDLQNLVSMASEGLLYRRQLEFDAIRFGMIRDEGRFDVDLQMRIMRSLPSLQDLREYTNQLRDGAMRKLAVNDVTLKTAAEFGLSPSRQTNAGAPGTPAKSINNRSFPAEIDSWNNFEL